MPDTMHMLAVVGIVAVLTFVLRLTPFVLMGSVKDSRALQYLAKVLPAGVMLILVVYTLRGVSLHVPAQWAPASVGILATLGLHLWRGQVLLSLLGGVGAYALTLALI